MINYDNIIQSTVLEPKGSDSVFQISRDIIFKFLISLTLWGF